MKLIKKFDIFGHQFYFRINEERTYKTYIGGILTIICVAIMVLVTFLFGSDFFDKTNSKILYQTVFPEQYYQIKPQPDNFTIAWRLEDVNGNPVANQDILHGRLEVFNYVLNTTTNLYDSTSWYFPPTKCSTIKVLDPNFKAGRNLNDWHCLDFSQIDFNWGGDWQIPFLGLFRLNLYSCLNDDRNSTCTSYEDLTSITNGPDKLYFSILYPKYTLAPDNLTNPIQYQYENFFELISSAIQKSQLYHFNEVYIYDDQGWIFQDTKEDKIVTLGSKTPDLIYVSEEDYKSPDSDTTVYRNVFFFSKNYEKYNRSFMKVQELVAQVGGMLKLLMVVFTEFGHFFSNLQLKSSLVNKFYIFKKEEKTSTYLKSEFNDNLTTLNLKVAKSTNNVQHSSSNTRIRLVSDLNKLSNINPSNILVNNNESNYNIHNVNLEELKQKLLQKKEKQKISFLTNIRFLFCKKCSSENEKRTIQLKKKYLQLLNHKFNIDYYLKTCFIVDGIKHIILKDKQQRKLFNSTLKKSVHSNEGLAKSIIPEDHQDEEELSEGTIEEIITYYSQKQNMDKLTEIDRMIINLS